MDLMNSRKSVYKFKQKVIKLTTLKKLVNAGRLAPSVGNKQPLEYILIINNKIKEDISLELHWPDCLIIPKEDEKPVAYIVILINKKISSNADIEIGASAVNINIVAQEDGIGCCWMDKFNKESVERILKLPKNYTVGLILALGYPA